MTREEAKLYIVKMYFDDDCFGQDFEAFVESLYDDFETKILALETANTDLHNEAIMYSHKLKEAYEAGKQTVIDEFKSRTCDNCKFHKPYKWSDTKDGFICELGYSVLCEGCNKWRGKDD